MPDQQPLDGTLTRFLTQSDHFSREQKRVKERAFLPAPDLSLSVFRINNLSEDEIWELCERLPKYGRGDFPTSLVLSIGLRAEPDNDPPRHVNIVGWPPEKSAQKSLAQLLAAEATLCLNDCNM